MRRSFPTRGLCSTMASCRPCAGQRREQVWVTQGSLTPSEDPHPCPHLQHFLLLTEDVTVGGDAGGREGCDCLPGLLQPLAELCLDLGVLSQEQLPLCQLQDTGRDLAAEGLRALLWSPQQGLGGHKGQSRRVSHVP